MEQRTMTSAPALGAALKPRQLTMMGLGSAIGAGLFIGSGAGIQAAGPAVLISYLVAGTLIILVMWALGEMAAANPDSGAFSVYTARAFGPVAGATVGWLWWLQLVVVIAAEALGAAGLLSTIFPALPVWLMAFVFIAVLTAVNLTQVKNFGEFEFWFALLKVAAIVGFLLIGVALLFGWLPGIPSPGVANFTGGDFAPARFRGDRHGALRGGFRLRRHRDCLRGRSRNPGSRPQRRRRQSARSSGASSSSTSARSSSSLLWFPRARRA
jgi:AAT family amino acid transporter